MHKYLPKKLIKFYLDLLIRYSCSPIKFIWKQCNILIIPLAVYVGYHENEIVIVAINVGDLLLRQLLTLAKKKIHPLIADNTIPYGCSASSW